MSDCIFCKIAAGEIPVEAVYEDDEIIAFNDINPQTEQHVLIIPRRHIQSVAHLKPADQLLMGKLIAAAQIIAQKSGILDAGFRLVINTGDDGGQTVAHLHVHLLAGRRMQWPPG